jgi:hypothetical protein
MDPALIELLSKLPPESLLVVLLVAYWTRQERQRKAAQKNGQTQITRCDLREELRPLIDNVGDLAEHMKTHHAWMKGRAGQSPG